MNSMTPTDPPPHSTTRLWPAVVGVVLMTAVIGVVGTLVISDYFDKEPSEATTPDRPKGHRVGTVRLEPVTYRSEQPFTESVVVMTDDELYGASRRAATHELPSGPVAGDTSLLYGSRRSSPPCDVAELARLLTEDTGTQAAWAGVVGVEPTAVTATVHSLTPVLLSADTAVTNHVYDSSGAEALQSILQAGTPVLVDDRGMPRVQCSCGNPLLPPEQESTAETQGDTWESFDHERVIEIEPAPKPTPGLKTVDVETEQEDEVSLGGAVSLDGILATTETGVVVIDDSGATTTVIDQPVGQVFDDGAGGLVYTLERSDFGAYGWPDGPPDDPADGAIWHLASGASEAVSLTDQSDTETWNHLMAVGTLGDATYVVFSPLHLEEADALEPTPTGPIVALNMKSGETTQLEEYGFGWEYGYSSASFGGDRLALSGFEISPGWELFDASLKEIETPCVGEEEYSGEEEYRCPATGALNDDGDLVTISSSFSQDPRELDSETAVTIDLLTLERSKQWTLPFGLTPDVQAYVTQVASGTLGLTFMNNETEDPTPGGELIDLESGKFHDFPDDLKDEIRSVWILRAPLLRPAVHPGSKDEPSPEPTSAPAESPTWDEIKNAEIPEMCTHPPTKLVDGEDVTLSEYDGYFQLLKTLYSESPGLVQGIPSEAGPLTAVVVSCNAGGVGWPNDVMFFAAGGKFYGVADMNDADWDSTGDVAPARDGILKMRLRGEELEVTTAALVGEEPFCCPTGQAVLRMQPRDGDVDITIVSTTTD